MRTVLLSVCLCLAAACGDSSSGAGPDAGTPDAGDPVDEADADTGEPLCQFRACGDDGAGGSCGTCDDTCSPFGQCVRADTGLPAVIFVFDQGLHAIVRLEDGNGDGDMLDDGEATIFFDQSHPTLSFFNSLGMVAVDADTVIVADNAMSFDEEPAQILYLADENGDGDALDDGEARQYFTGALPGGHTLHLPTGLRTGTDGALYLSENNYDGATNPEAIYRLVDENGDRDVMDPGEVTVAAELEPAGDSMLSTWEAVLDASGHVYVKENADAKDATMVHRVGEGGDLELFLSGYWLFPATENGENLVLAYTPGELGYLPHTDEIVTVAENYGGDTFPHLIAVRDHNDTGQIESLSELRILWDAGADASDLDVNAKDFAVLDDGSIVVIGKDALARLVDENGDGDMNDAGEQILVFDGAASPLGATTLWTVEAVIP